MLELQSSEFILSKDATTGDDACAYSIIDNALLVSVLCDGVGSAARGGTAARQCVKFFIDQFKNRPRAWDIPKTMEVFTRHINSLLFKESMTQYGKIELLTTLCLAVIEGRTYTPSTSATPVSTCSKQMESSIVLARIILWMMSTCPMS